ncbi:helix-turn-helix domain-containing protein [Photobacterium sp. ZSDE20]|nr:helix-turn-helix domain-containing protein [Photobacterium sp. ZSDE20]
MFNKEVIGKTLANARKNRGLTQREIAAQIGIPATTLSKIENGHFSGSLKILYYYADYLGYEITLITKRRDLPDWHELDTLFDDD